MCIRDRVIGSFNSESLFSPLQAENSEQSLLEACGRGYFVVGILGVNQEPVSYTHLLGCGGSGNRYCLFSRSIGSALLHLYDETF